ncbi:MAG: EAL and HDOD domain-containing protein [Thermodesulfobacteriota bacterium]
MESRESENMQVQPDGSSIFVARQPIFRQNGTVYGYELLFRSGLGNFFDASHDGDTATSKVITNTFSLIGISRLTEGRKAFINFSADMLVKEYPGLFPSSITVAEVLENIRVTPEVVQACRNLVKRGYILALDDFRFNEELLPLIEIAQIIKFDIRAMTVTEMRRDMAQLATFDLKFLAEKVETIDEFEQMQSVGCSLFQGYFFSRPKIVQGRDIPGSKLQYLKIIKLIQDENYNFSRLTEFIAHDVSLSYKLLRYVNSAAMRRRVEVTSLQSAVALVGEVRLRKWLSLMMLSYMANDKPLELLRLALLRASFCEQIGEQLGKGREFTRSCYTVGIFSLIDVLLDQPMKVVLAELNLATAIVDTLTGDEKTPFTAVLALVMAYERADWDAVARIAGSRRGLLELLPRFYEKALEEVRAFYFDQSA